MTDFIHVLGAEHLTFRYFLPEISRVPVIFEWVVNAEHDSLDLGRFESADEWGHLKHAADSDPDVLVVHLSECLATCQATSHLELLFDAW